MHVLIGVLMTVGAFWLSRWAQLNLPYFGLVNPGAMVLLVLGPLGVTVFSHPWKEWRATFSVLLRAFRHNPNTELMRGSEEMTQVARAVRESRWQEAEDAVHRARSEQVRLLTPHLLARLEAGSLAEAIGSTAFRWMAEVRLADEFFQHLGRLCPAFGMIGTIMGLVDLFANMRDSKSLGPGMALALLATLYGLILCYVIYLPLAQRVRAYLSAGVGEQRLIERSIGLIVDGRPVHEVRNALLDAVQNGAAPSLPPPAPEAGAR